ncbi:MAG: hypothetical protein P1V35_02235 [Planctomycetota bacterium]|nr:hypothetical protein [Planctomycetota bacterium]
MSPSDLTSSLGQAETHPLRALLQLGLILVCLLAGGATAVALYGPSMMGPSLASSHFSTLNNRITGVLAHDESDLSWTGNGHIQELRLVGADDTEVLRGSLYVPRLLDWWSGGLIPEKANVALDILTLKIDEQGRFNLLENLVAKAGVDEISPFFDPELLRSEVNYYGIIEKLLFEDARSDAPGIEWLGGNFGIRWSPDGHGTLTFELPNDAFRVKLDWEGMGETFDLASLRGVVEFDGDSSELESILGFPGGITGFMTTHSRVRLEFGGTENGKGGVVPIEVLIGNTAILGDFDGQSFRMIAGAEPPALSMVSFAGLGLLMEGVSSGMPETIKDKLKLQVQEHGTWKWMLKGLTTGVVPLDPTLPLLEGLLASSRLSLGFELSSGLALAPRHVTGEALDVGKATLDWDYDPETLGRGKLAASSALDPNRANLVLGVNKSARKSFELNWTGPSPMPSVGSRMETVNLSHALTRFYTRYLPAWGISLSDVLGISCSLDIARVDSTASMARHGGIVPSWEVKVIGAKAEEPITFFVGEGAVWLDPDETRTLPLQPDQHAGIYETFFSRFLPWFEVLKVNGTRSQAGQLALDVSNLIFRGEKKVWKLEEGFVELSQLDDVEYQIKSGWEDVWVTDEDQALEPFDFTVEPGKVSFEELPFPVGLLAGEIDLDNDSVMLKLVEMNPLFEFLPGEFQNFAKGVTVIGPVRDPACNLPMGNSGEDS